ncbi:hypothetical protein [Kitasatospora sp. MAP5-34]|uniref:hypothetical protein n=1 Tax=Kitasatospora sp. MAP5-34 TaxID=3035102 RepID=UPI002473615E|nr:hypothetical protein [Kitasatospora sp. MAP5-34]MDH6577851.1 hypothetical protein [Kitasatospora sp. MAP5-34]
MRSQVLRRGSRMAAVAALAFLTTIGGSGAAVAGPPGDAPIEVSLGAAGIQAPGSHDGGPVSFRVKTDDPAGRQLQVIRPHLGVSIDQVLHDLADAVSNTPATAAAGIRAVEGEAEALGGAFVTPQAPEEFTQEISDGPVYLLDFTAFLANPTEPVLKSLELCGSNGRHLAHFPHGIVIQRETTAGPRFEAEDVDRANGAILVHNAAPELHEMELQPVAPGTTDAQIQAYFDAIAHGTTPPPAPFTGPPAGLSAISPDHTVLLETHGLQPGTYVLLCFVPDDQLGIPHAFLGMHQVVQLH